MLRSRLLSRPRLALPLLAAGLFACQLLDDGEGANAKAGPEPAPVPEVHDLDLAALDLPTEPPFVGEPGVDPFGYPLAQPDQLALLNLLRLRRFEQLDRFMHHYQDQFEADPGKEYWPDLALAAFFTHEPMIGERVDEWLRRHPDSFAAQAAVANFQFQLAQRSDTRVELDLAALARAEAGFEAALARRPQYVAARRRLIQIATLRQDPTRARAELDAAVASCPSCYIPHGVYLEHLRPRWGGSVEAMAAYIAETSPRAEQHPKLRALAGFLAWDECSRLVAAEAPRELGLPACEKALGFGDDERFLATMARLHSQADDCAAALPYLDRALARTPFDEPALRVRYYCRSKLGDWLGSGRDLFKLQHLDPLGRNIPKGVEQVVDQLRYTGQELGKAGKHVEAAEYFALGLQLAPSDEDMAKRQAWNQKSIGFEDAQRQLAAAPNDFALHLRIDHGLAASGRFAEVVTLWDRFITAHPDDPRPYVERGGAKWKLRQLDAAIADMTQACRLGLESACADVPRMRQRAGR